MLTDKRTIFRNLLMETFVLRSMAPRQLLKKFLLFALYSTVAGNIVEIRNYDSQERKRSILSEGHSCQEKQCAPGHCIEVLGRATCLCPEAYRSDDGKCVEERCSEPILCWPGKCTVKYGRETCLCPEGFLSSHGLCIRAKNEDFGTMKKCQRTLNCFPGECFILQKKEVCLCPPGFASEQGFCKGVTNVCGLLDCKPGRCVKEFGAEKCLCPTGYTARNDKCVEITLQVPGTLTTVMLMVIVSSASVILTTLFGVGICYYFSQRS